MNTSVHEIADGVYRLSTCVPDVVPGGFTFNQYLIDAEEPLLFHTGPRRMFPLVADAVGRVLDLVPTALDQLRPRRGRRVRRDERVARRSARGAGDVQPARLPGLGRGPRRPPARARGRRRASRSRRPRRPHDRDPPRPARMGGAGAPRRDDRHAAVRRPVHPHRRRPGARPRHRSHRPRPRGRGPVRRHGTDREHGARRCAPSRTSSRARSPSCTARRSSGTPPEPCATSPTPTRRV